MDRIYHYKARRRAGSSNKGSRRRERMGHRRGNRSISSYAWAGVKATGWRL